jgi:hypothetical protein
LLLQGLQDLHTGSIQRAGNLRCMKTTTAVACQADCSLAESWAVHCMRPSLVHLRNSARAMECPLANCLASYDWFVRMAAAVSCIPLNNQPACLHIHDLPLHCNTSAPAYEKAPSPQVSSSAAPLCWA